MSIGAYKGDIFNVPIEFYLLTESDYRSPWLELQDRGYLKIRRLYRNSSGTDMVEVELAVEPDEVKWEN